MAYNAYLAVYRGDYIQKEGQDADGFKTLVVRGSSLEMGHEGWIKVEEFEHGMMQPHSGITESGQQWSGQPADHETFNIKKPVDRATPWLALNSANGKMIGNITFEVWSATDDCELRIELWNCYIYSFSVSGRRLGGQDSPLPSEDVRFTYDRIAWHYRPVAIPTTPPTEPSVRPNTNHQQDGSGQGWNIKGNATSAII